MFTTWFGNLGVQVFSDQILHQILVGNLYWDNWYVASGFVLVSDGISVVNFGAEIMGHVCQTF